MLKLLIVDDERRTREGLRKCIPWSSYGIGHIEDADDGSTALEISKHFRPDIIISDIRMSNMTGIEFVSLIRKELPDCKIIFISGYSDKEYLKSAIRLKAINYIEKPINIKELKSAVQLAAEACNQEILRNWNLSETSMKLEKSIELIEKEFAAYLAEKNPGIEQTDQFLSLLNLNIPPDATYVTLLFKLNPGFDASIQKQDFLRTRLIDMINTTFVQKGIKSITGLKDGMHLLTHIHLSSALTLQMLSGIAEEIVASFDKTFDTENSLFVGIGVPVQGVDNIHQSFQTAFLAVQKIFFLGRARSIIYHENANAAYKLDKELLEHYCLLLSQSDQNAVISFIEKIVENIRRYDATLIDNVKNFFFLMHIKLYEEAEEKLLSSFLQNRNRIHQKA